MPSIIEALGPGNRQRFLENRQHRPLNTGAETTPSLPPYLISPDAHRWINSKIDLSHAVAIGIPNVGIRNNKHVFWVEVPHHSNDNTSNSEYMRYYIKAADSNVPQSRGSVTREINGYEAAHEVPSMASHIPPFFGSREQGVIIVPNLAQLLGGKAVELRDAQTKQGISPEMAATIGVDSLTRNLEWSKESLERNATMPEVSMQREEWPTVKHGIGTLTRKLGERLNTRGIDVFRAPIILNGHTRLPSLGETVESLERFYNTPTPTAFGNPDIGSKNIMVNPDTGRWDSIDLEKVGRHDMAEACDHGTKGKGTYGVSKINGVDAKLIGGRLWLNVDYTDPDPAVAFEDATFHTAREFAREIGDKDLISRALAYRGGVNLNRAVSLATSGNNYDGMLFTVAMTGHNLNRSRHEKRQAA